MGIHAWVQGLSWACIQGVSWAFMEGVSWAFIEGVSWACQGEGGVSDATKAWIKEAGRMNHLKHIVP